MKNLIFLILFFSAVVSFAQKFEVGLNGGVSYNNVLKTGLDNSSSVFGWASLNFPVSSVKVMRVSRNWQYGLAVDYCRYSVRYKHAPYTGTAFVSWFSPTNGPWDPPTVISTGSTYCVPVKLFVNRKKTLTHFEPYAGLSAGYVFWRFTPADAFESAFTYSLGLQSGFTYFVSKRFGINAELACDYLWFESDVTINFSTVSVPITIGVRYKL